VSPSGTLVVLSKRQQPEGSTMECTVPVEVRLASEQADVGSLERTISAALAEVGTMLWAALIERLEAALPRPVACPSCGGRLVANGRAPRRLVTLAGEVDLRRRRYRCLGCGTEVIPLDAALGLAPRTQHTLGVRERALWLVTEMSYQKAVDVAAELRRWPIGRGELHRWVAEEGARLEAARATETEALLGAHPERRSGARRGGTVWVSADGTMVHDRATGTELEVKIGLVFDGARRVGRTRQALTGRTFDAGTEGWTAFAERFTALCATLGVYEAERILFVSDGASSIRWIRERSFPDAIELLDWYHLVEALRRAIGPERPDRLAAALAAAEPGDAERLLELLAGWAYEEAGVDRERSDKLAAVCGYIAANRQAIENYRIVPLASSGPMEKAVDIVVARRFKARGMSWFRRGVSALVRLRLLRLNGTWTRYWADRFAAGLRPWPAEG
jgi:DNA-directed RNA polymerase subunit RPC12/RpoP